MNRFYLPSRAIGHWKTRRHAHGISPLLLRDTGHHVGRCYSTTWRVWLRLVSCQHAEKSPAGQAERIQVMPLGLRTEPKRNTETIHSSSAVRLAGPSRGVGGIHTHVMRGTGGVDQIYRSQHLQRWRHSSIVSASHTDVSFFVSTVEVRNET